MMMPAKGRALGPIAWALLSALGSTLAVDSAAALNADEARGRAELALRAVEQDIPRVDAKARAARILEIAAERRIAEGDILLREKNYEGAIHVLEQVKELCAQGKAPGAAHADALFLLGEAYLADEQLLSARRQYQQVLDRAQEPTHTSYAGRSLSRLVDVALRSGDLSGLDDVFARLSKLPQTDATGSLQYARGKAYFAKGEMAPAREALATVPASSPHALQTQYLLGVVLTREAMVAPPATPGALPRFAAAVDHFRKVTKMPADSDAEHHVIDLAWMAIGRLFYESDDYLDAADAYGHVDRKSPEFSVMLFELAWVYVRLGDYQRAQRALEVLTITDPESLRLADGSLLRADLMLRSGQFDKALKAYQNVRGRFDPIRSKVDEFLAATSDPAVYYDQLVEEGLSSGAGKASLPPMVLEWARQEAEDARVFAVIDDVTRSRDLVRKSRTLAGLLNAVLGAPTRVKAFPEVRAALEVTLGLVNRVALSRRDLAYGMDDVVAPRGGGQSAAVREERRALMKRLGWVPVTAGDFAQREGSAERQWNALSQQLQRLTLEADKLQAVVNGLKRVMDDAEQFGVTRDVASRQRFRSEIQANERDLETYRKRVVVFQEAVEMGRVQVGFGDQRYVEDALVRRRFREVFEQEVALAAGGSDGAKAADYARSIRSALARAATAEAQLEPIERRLQEVALARAVEMRSQIAREVANLELYASNLDKLDQEARLLVGEVAMRNLGLVRDRLKGIVLRADVGIVQEAWEVREEQRIRVQNLQRERAVEERKLDDELREVLDDAEESQ